MLNQKLNLFEPVNNNIILKGDVFASLLYLQDESIDCAITSPPYWSQRDYGFDGQIGVENDYFDYISKMIKIFGVLKNKLKDRGVFFLNIGDKYLNKYGKTPLGFIPFKLAYFMTKQGWRLEETIIWYKPNHMPSSVKNRFTNSYEPVFVFSKNKNNIFNEKKHNLTYYSNILKVRLQPSSVKHIAAYPEKLINQLIGYIEVKENYVFLDPFAGSGTTMKVVDDYSFNKGLNCKSIMIENNDEYVEIMRRRCGVNPKNIINIDYINYSYDTIQQLYDIKIKESDELNMDKFDKNGVIFLCNSNEEFYKKLQYFKSKTFKEYFNQDAIFFIGVKEWNLNTIYNATYLNEMGWVIRNLIIVEKDNKWFPLFFIVDNNNFKMNKFSYHNLYIKSKQQNGNNWTNYNFIGMRVRDNLSKKKREGIVVKLNETYENDYPKYLTIKWDDGSYSKEYVVYDQKEVDSNVQFEHDNKFIVSEKKEIKTNISINKTHSEFEKIIHKPKIKNYNGKFKDIPKNNWGASPGARSSIEEEVFIVKKLYSLDQNYIADYLNVLREKRGLTKNELIRQFPSSYKHTVGHWLRNDFGGSIPTNEDWDKLKKILEIDKNIDKYISKTALKLSTINQNVYKPPDDFIDITFVDKLLQLSMD